MCQGTGRTITVPEVHAPHRLLKIGHALKIQVLIFFDQSKDLATLSLCSTWQPWLSQESILLKLAPLLTLPVWLPKGT